MQRYILKLIGGFFGSVGFGYLFHAKRKNILIGSIGGVLGTIVYILCEDFFHFNVFMCSFLGGLTCELYSEVMARVEKAPSTTFFMIAFLPLVPGGLLYYCIENIVAKNTSIALTYGINAFLTALGITIGMAVGWALCDLVRKLKRIKNK